MVHSVVQECLYIIRLCHLLLPLQLRTADENARSRAPTLQKPSPPSGVPSTSSGVNCLRRFLHHKCCLCFLACAQLNGCSCDRFCPHTQFESVPSCPNLLWYALKCPWPDLAAISHPWTSLLSFSSRRDFACEVGFRPSSTYVCAAPENALFSHSDCQLASLFLLIFRLALLTDCCKLSPVAGGRFACFFAS